MRISTVEAGTYVEVPYDPPAWTAQRRDFLFASPIMIAPDGTIAPPAGPGLGIEPDFNAIDALRIA